MVVGEVKFGRGAVCNERRVVHNTDALIFV